MAVISVALPKNKKSKEPKEIEIIEYHTHYPNSFLYKIIAKIPITLFFLLLIFLWSSSTTVISGSIVHVCVSSRKLNNLYCLSAGTQPANYTIPFSLINNASRISLVNDSAKSFDNKIAEIPALVLKDSASIDIELAVSGNSSKEKVSDGVSREETSGSMEESSSFSSSFVDQVLEKSMDKAKAEEITEARRHVEGQMEVLRSYIAKSKPMNCDGRGVYVHDLPPKFNKDLLSYCREIYWLDFCKFLTNNGLGEPIPELGKDWYNTNQYALELIFHSHVLNHPCRVHNPEEAKLFYVPLYGGMDILRWHFKKVPNDVKDLLSKEIVDWLEEQKTWKRNLGLDHVFVLGKISWDFRRKDNVTWGSRLLEFNELHNPMKLLIERHPWHINGVGVPHPTYFHPSSDEDILSWQSKIRTGQRKNLISFAGAPRKAFDSIRSILIEQCKLASNTCKFFDCTQNACFHPSPVIKLFMKSEFCLQPPGDSPTRKSVFDSLIAGCIPVVFDPMTAYYQYPWHLPKDYKKYSVYIDEDEVRMSEVNVVERLVKIPLKERQEMRKYIIDELMPKLVYSNPNGKLDKFEDAFAISMNNLLERVVRVLP